VLKTQELKKRSWGREKIRHVSFGSRLPCERLSLLSVKLDTRTSPRDQHAARSATRALPASIRAVSLRANG